MNQSTIVHTPSLFFLMGIEKKNDMYSVKWEKVGIQCIQYNKMLSKQKKQIKLITTCCKKWNVTDI